MLPNKSRYILTMFLLIIIKKISAVSYNQPKFCPSATWDPNAITFANESILGTDYCHTFVDSNNIVYVASKEKKALLVGKSDVAFPTATMKKMDGVEIKSLNPYALFVTTAVDIYGCNVRNNDNEIYKWRFNESAVHLIENIESPCYGIFVDINNTLYCSMCLKHKVVKTPLNDNSGPSFTTAAGTGTEGSNSTSLRSPNGIFVDVNFDLYVADSGNHRIQRFHSDQLNATTVAGDGSLTPTIKLKYPTGIVLDADKYLFIVDSENHRIVGSGPNGFRCLVGCFNSSGSAANKLDHPYSLSFDSSGNIFVSDTWNYRIQKFLLSTNSCNETTTSKPTTTSPTIYTTRSTALETPSRTSNTTSWHDGRETTTKPISTVHETKSVNATQSVEVTTANTTPVQSTLASVTKTTEITLITTTINEPPSKHFVPEPCNESKLIGPHCNSSSSACDLLQPCQNNSFCHNDDTKPNGYMCACPPGFYSIDCQFDHRPCDPNPCWHDGTCNTTSNSTFNCLCLSGWHGNHCEIMDNYCDDNKCQNNGVCRPSFRNYTCQCLGDSFSGVHCEITAIKVTILRIVSKSFAYVAIIALVSVAMFIVIMDILKYCFGIDPVHEERERMRRKKRMQKRKPVIQRFVYVNAPTISSSS